MDRGQCVVEDAKNKAGDGQAQAVTGGDRCMLHDGVGWEGLALCG